MIWGWAVSAFLIMFIGLAMVSETHRPVLPVSKAQSQAKGQTRFEPCLAFHCALTFDSAQRRDKVSNANGQPGRLGVVHADFGWSLLLDPPPLPRKGKHHAWTITDGE